MSHVRVSALVPSVRAVLASGAAGFGAVSDRVAPAAAVSSAGNRGSRCARADLGGCDVACEVA